MKRKIFIQILLISFLLAANIQFVDAHNITNTKESTATNNILVTDTGFSPKKITITKGTAVTWINNGNALHWPASDIHPTHTVYPGSTIEKCLTPEKGTVLDACRGLKHDEKFSFTFNEIGKWGMHDHLYPGYTMSVEVTESNDNLMTLFTKIIDFLKKLFQSNASQYPSSESFRGLTYIEQQEKIRELGKANPKGAWEYLKKVFLVGGQIRENPHEFAHIIGNEIYNQNGFGGIAACDDEFAFGCYHGVTEKMLLDLGIAAVPKLERSCLKIFPNQPQRAASCIHGSGHGLLSWEGLNITKALGDCDILSAQYRTYCYDGVFMEYSFSAPKNALNPDKPWQFCASFGEQYQPLCAKYHSQLFGSKFGWGFPSIAQSCSQAPNTILKNGCLMSVGYFAANLAKGDANEIKKSCSLLSIDDGRYSCITNAAVEVIFQEYENWWSVSKILCEELPEDWKSECGNRTQRIIEGYNKQIPASSNPIEIQQIKAADNLDKQTKLYKELIERVGPEQAQEHLYNSGLPFTGQTHLLNHAVGDYLYEKYGNAGLVRCKDYFLSSCYHGFILHAIPDGLGAIDDIVNECKKFGITVVSQCSHAIGHGFLTWVGYSNLTGALGLCDEMGERVENFPLYNCRDGVFMENVWGIHEGKPSPDRWVRGDDNFYPCNDSRINPKHLDGCWSNQPTLMYQMFKGDIKKVGEECLKVKNAEHQKICFNGLSRQIHPLTKGDADTAFKLCSLLPSQWVNYCLTTITLSDFSVGGRDLSFKICARINVSEKENCYTSLFGVMSVYDSTSDEHENSCKNILEESWQEKCVSRFSVS